MRISRDKATFTNRRTIELWAGKLVGGLVGVVDAAYLSDGGLSYHISLASGQR